MKIAYNIENVVKTDKFVRTNGEQFQPALHLMRVATASLRSEYTGLGTVVVTKDTKLYWVQW